jgi:hypothetical protein
MFRQNVCELSPKYEETDIPEGSVHTVVRMCILIYSVELMYDTKLARAPLLWYAVLT